MKRRVLFLGGNGHSVARLAPAQQALDSNVQLIDAQYPGFDGRARSASFDEFLERVAERARLVDPALVYATGIGGLIALALRARGELRETPIVLQGAVLWGLEQRTFARVMRGPLPHLLRWMLRTSFVRRRFIAKHLPADVDPELAQSFFDGYASCTAFADFFRWMRAPLLRQLEASLRAEPEALESIRFWWGEHDRVVGLEELRRTEHALGVDFPGREFAGWGHYPMIEDPRGWAEALEREVA